MTTMNAHKLDLNATIPLQERALYTLLSDLGIPYDVYTHPPIFTVEEGRDLKKHIPGRHGKNLFLTNKTKNHWLVCAADDTRANLKFLSDKLETKRFSFGKAETLKQILDVEPGHVNPFSLRFDTEKQISEIILDEELSKASHVVFHPWRNDKSIVVPFDGLVSYIKHFGYAYRIEQL